MEYRHMHSLYRYMTVLHKHVRGPGRLSEAVVGGEVDDREHEIGVRS